MTDVRHAVLSKQQCKKISSVFYENDQDGLSSFIREVEAQMEDNQPDKHPRERRISAIQFIILMMSEFESSKHEGKIDKSYHSMHQEPEPSPSPVVSEPVAEPVIEP